MVDREILRRALAVKAARHDALVTQLEQPEVLTKHEKVRALSRELSTLARFADVHRRIVEAETSGAEARSLLDDEEMRELAEMELAEVTETLDTAWAQAEEILGDDNEFADRDVILEIRAGVGGDEAALFAGDLFTMYSHFCQRHRLKVEILNENAGDMGGYKELVAQVTGNNAYQLLRFESGGHRVQRVPKTESQGRIHTSAATVAVLPKAEDVDVQIDWDKDVREDTMRAGGPGGQSVNKTESAVRLIHLETGITVQQQDEKSQHKNRAKARSILISRIFDHLQQQVDRERAAKRKSMVGSGDRSQRVRTYNFPQNRVTDHRLEWSLHDLEGVLLGSLDAFHERLGLAEREQRLMELAESASE